MRSLMPIVPYLVQMMSAFVFFFLISIEFVLLCALKQIHVFSHVPFIKAQLFSSAISQDNPEGKTPEVCIATRIDQDL